MNVEEKKQSALYFLNQAQHYLDKCKYVVDATPDRSKSLMLEILIDTSKKCEQKLKEM